VKEIELTQGYVAIVDDEDYDRLSQFKWRVHLHRYTAYAKRWDYNSSPPKVVYMHREILGCQKGQQADHRDGNGLNNSRSNLRMASHAQNMQNCRRSKKNTTGFKGVYFDRRKKKFHVLIRVNGARNFIGYFDTPEKAHAAYCEAAEKYHQEFARFA
jgi:hypothetical protein